MTTMTLPMLETFPTDIDLDRGLLARTIDALVACSQTCTACSAACLSEESVAELTACIRTDLDCAAICATTARVLSRPTEAAAGVAESLLEACIVACRTCGDQCAMHADHHEHCRICADACRACEQACGELLATF